MFAISPDTDIEEKSASPGSETADESAAETAAAPVASSDQPAASVAAEPAEPFEVEAAEPFDADAPATPDMEAALEKVRQAATRYNSTPADKNLKATRALSAAMKACKDYIKENAHTDRGCAQRLVRALEDTLSQVRIVAGLFSDPRALNRLHTRRLAEEHLDRIEEHLSSVLKAADEEKAKEINNWVMSHPVFGPLRKTHMRKLPPSVYILLFRKGADGQPELVTERSQDGRIFTRFRPHEFMSNAKLFKDYQNKAPIIGGALISTGSLHKTMGTLPPAPEGKDQLQHLVALSNSAAAAPAREFISLSPVLNQLHELSRQKKLDSETYILLFQLADESAAGASDIASPGAEAEALETEAETAATAPEALAIESEPEVPAGPAEEAPEQEALEQETLAAEPSEEASEEPAAELPAGPLQSGEEVGETVAGIETEPDAAAQTEGEPDAEIAQPASPPEPAKNQPPQVEIDNDEATYGPVPANARFVIMTKKTADGRVFTRYKAIDFIARKALFESFRATGNISGAAVIKGRRLLRIIGHVPQAGTPAAQLSLLMDASSEAMEGPAKSYVAANEVLKALHDMASAPASPRQAEVILFTAEGGKLEALSVRDERNKLSTRVPLSEFLQLKAIHARFSNLPAIAGASVIGEYSAPSPKGPAGKPDNRGGPGQGGRPRPDSRGDGRSDSRRSSRQVVLAAFGRTPLKKDLLATPETFARLRINL